MVVLCAAQAAKAAKAVRRRSGWQVSATQQAFESIVGKRFASGKQCSDRAQLTTMEAVLTTRPVFAVN